MDDIEMLARRWVWGQADHECGGRDHRGDCFKCDSGTASLVALLRRAQEQRLNAMDLTTITMAKKWVRQRDERALRIVEEEKRRWEENAGMASQSFEAGCYAKAAHACDEIKRRIGEVA